MKLSNHDLADLLEVRGKYERPAQPHPWLKSISMLLVALGLVMLCGFALVMLRQLAFWIDTNDYVAGAGGGLFILVFVLALTAKR